ncbi:hypothetical protein M404DRAFT_996514 [Pisolithus tinctorius Marx 270]|uniref:Uncharacterized protein n=1 Tax=Pisolithus tinctorius Marx 270 TaxID=870435 RepID=A0A0C3KJD0_PISTI|nr:hypothetical protein M404DRAFT_996514 [Pisolithus tinctorius Marx 270]
MVIQVHVHVPYQAHRSHCTPSLFRRILALEFPTQSVWYHNGTFSFEPRGGTRL